MPIADEFDGFLIDLDGVVWIGREPVPGSAAALAQLLATGKRIAFVTNNPSHPPAAYAERLREIGAEVDAGQVVTAGTVAARLAAEAAPGGSAFVIGRAVLKETVAAAGLTVLEGEGGRSAGVVVVSGHPGFGFDDLLTAKRALDAGAALIGTSRDPTMPMPGGAWPGSGAVLAAVETASGRSAEIAGKPERHLFELALDSLARGSFRTDDVQKEPQVGQGDGLRVAMVGDRIDSDIVGGRQAGLATVLVLSGAGSRADAEAAEPPPDHVVDDLAGLLL